MTSPHRRPPSLVFPVLFLIFFLCGAAYGQTLSLASGSAAPGGTVSLNLSSSGSGLAAVQWTLSYSSTAITSVKIASGAASTAAGKAITCNTTSGSSTCIASGMNGNTIASGVVAVVTVTVAASATSSIGVAVGNALGVLPNGTSMAVSGAGGTVSVSQTAAPTVSGLSCAPSTIASGGNSTCTVTLSAAAPGGGATVTLSDNSSSLSTPGSVGVAGSATSATFSVTGGSVTSNQSVTVTAALNGSSASTTVTITAPSTASGSCPCTIWTPNTVPGTVDPGDAASVELGVRFRSDVSGFITAVRFYKSAANTGRHIGNLWSNSGKLLATATFTGESSSGWQQVKFSSPVAVAAGTTYIASYFAPRGHYSFDVNYFANGGVDQPPLHALSNSAAGGNGVFIYAASSKFPNSTYKSANYWVDVVFTTASSAATANAIPASTAMTPPRSNSKQPFTNVGQPSPVVSALSCSPGTAGAGDPVTCELRVTASSTPMQLQLESNSDEVKVPGVVTTRAEQSSLTFQAFVESAARQQSAVIAAMLGDSRVESTIRVMPSPSPVLTAPGRQIGRFGSPLSFVVSAVDPSDLPVQLAAGGVPDGASFDPASGRFDWTPNASQAGKYEVTFTAVDAAAQASTRQVSIEVDRGTPVLTASKEFSCSPGAVARLNGRWLGASAIGVSDPTGGAMELGGSQVKVNGQSVPVLFSSQTRVDFLCPALDAGTPLSVTVESNGSASAPLTTSMADASPAILSLDVAGQPHGLISFPDTADVAMARNFRVPAHPAQPGDPLLIWASGLGGTREISTVVELGGVPAPIESVNAVAGHAGVYTIQVRVPASASTGDAVPVQIHVAGPDGRQFHSNVTTAAVEAVRQ